METLLVIFAILLSLSFWPKRIKPLRSTKKILTGIQMPDKKRAELITPYQRKRIKDEGFRGFSDLKKHQAGLLISSIVYVQRACFELNKESSDKRIKNGVNFILNDKGFLVFVRNKNQFLRENGLDEWDVDIKKDTYFPALKKALT